MRFFSYKNVLNCLLCCSIAVSLYSILTYGQASIHSDTATATILAKSQLESASLFPENWYYANGDIWVFDRNLILLPFLHLFKNQSLLRMLVSAVWVSFAGLSLFLLCRISFKDSSYKLMIPFTLLFFTGAYDAMLFQAAYIGPITWISIALLLAILAINPPNKLISRKTCTRHLALFLLLFLLTMSGTRNLGEIVLPLCLTIILREILHIGLNKETNRLNAKALTAILGTILLASVLGQAAYYLICSYCNVVNTENNALVFSKDWQNNFTQYLANHLENFGVTAEAKMLSIQGMKNFVSIFFTLLISFVVPILQLRRIHQEKEPVVFVCLFSFIHNALMFLLIVFMGKTTHRYTLTSLFMELIVSTRYIYAYWIKGNKNRAIRNILVAIVSSGVLINSAYIASLSKGWYPRLQEQKELCSVLLATGASKGYATYWNAYKNEVYSDLSLRFGAVNLKGSRLEPYFWLVDSGIYDYTENEMTFLLLSDEELDYAAKEGILKDYTAPRHVVIYGNLTAFVYDYDIASKFYKKDLGGDFFLGEVLGNPALIATSELTFHDGTMFTKEGFPVSSGKQTLAYGPYVNANPGKYVINVLYDFIGTGSEQEIAEISVTSNDGKKVLERRTVSNAEKNGCTFTVNIPRKSKSVEIVCRTKTAGFILKGYEVQRLE